MKNNKLYQALSIGFVALALMFVCGQAKAQSLNANISLSLKTEKDSYVLGEVVDLRLRINNLSDKSLETAKPNVGSGNLKLFISEDGKAFREYVGPNWGIVSNPFRPTVGLETDGFYEVKATMLYNHRVPTEHLSELYAGKIRQERIASEFALLESGHYWLKAVLTDGKMTVRSEPVEIEVTVPVGSDAVVWEQIKADGAFAYFLHTGEVKYLAGSAEANSFVEKLRQISTDYPETSFNERLNERLVKYNRNIENVQRLRAEREAAN